MGIRAGTQNTQGIVSLGNTAIRMYKNMDSNRITVLAIKSELLKLTHVLEGIHVNSNRESSPYILNMSFMGVKGEVLVNMLSEKGIYVSTGAACKTSKKEVPALMQMGYNRERADSAIRFSFSHHNTVCEAKLVGQAVAECVTKLRKIRR